MRRLLVSSALCLSLASTVQAQWLVEEVGPNLLANSITSLQSVITAAQTVLLVADSLTNLLSVQDTGLEGLDAELMQLGLLATEVQGLFGSIDGLRRTATRLYDPAGAPRSTREWNTRQADIARHGYALRSKAMEIQTLQFQIRDVIARINRLSGRILDMLGNKQGSQLLQAQQAQMNQQLAKQAIVDSAFQQAMLDAAQAAPLQGESALAIAQEHQRSMPRPR